MPDFHIVENVKIVMRAELDRRTISFPDLMNLEAGSILELQRPTGENVDIYAGKVLIGNGEILVVDASLAVRIADLFQKTGAKETETVEASHSSARRATP
jgi:flagellar motor switch protein FliN/FliY